MCTCVCMCSVPHHAKSLHQHQQTEYKYTTMWLWHAVAHCSTLFIIIPPYSECSYTIPYVYGWAEAKWMASIPGETSFGLMLTWTLDGPSHKLCHGACLVATEPGWHLPPGADLSDLPVSKTCLKQGADWETKGGCLVGKCGPHVGTTQQCTHCLSSTSSRRLTLCLRWFPWTKPTAYVVYPHVNGGWMPKPRNNVAAFETLCIHNKEMGPNHLQGNPKNQETTPGHSKISCELSRFFFKLR